MRRFALLIALIVLPRLGAQPNILFLFADDQRPDTIGAWGNPRIETPNIDKLVAGGFSFRNNYCLGSIGEAVCAPSRAMLHTGKAYFRVPLDMEGHQTMGELLGKERFDSISQSLCTQRVCLGYGHHRGLGTVAGDMPAGPTGPRQFCDRADSGNGFGGIRGAY